MSDIIIIPLRNGGETSIDSIDSDLAERKWYRLPHGYAISSLSRRHPTHPNKKIYLHRVILARMIDRELTAKEFADHINGDRLNNTRKNLRLANKAQNQYNRGVSKDCKTGFKGVSDSGSSLNPWAARIRADGKDIGLGLYASVEDAARAYDRAAVELHGEFAHLNFPDDWIRDENNLWIPRPGLQPESA